MAAETVQRPVSPLRALRFALKRRRQRRAIARASRHRAASPAKVIAATGSSGKSTTTALLSKVLEPEGGLLTQVYRNTRIDLEKAMARLRPTTRHVALELGVSGPGQMEPMARIVQPDVAIITMIGREHYSAFRSREAVAAEKGELVKALRPDGVAVLNADDDLASAMASLTAARAVTFGHAAHADYRIVELAAGHPHPLTFTIEAKGRRTRISASFPGAHHAMTVTAAFAAACELGLAPETVAARIAGFQPMLNRSGLFPVPGGPTFIVDTIKAPYDTVELAIDMARRAEAPRRRIVIGHISDYPGAPRPKYQAIYRAAREASDEVIFVGDNSHRSGASDEDRASGRFREFATPRQAADYIRETAIPGELILLKSSANLHLERIALMFRHDVRCWVAACGRRGGCVECGLYEMPREAHRRLRRAKDWTRRLRRLTGWLSGLFWPDAGQGIA